MPEQTESVEASPTPPTPPLADWFLEELVILANDSGFGFGVTLQVGGLLVSGTLASGAAYFEGVAAETAPALEGDLAETFQKWFGNFRDLANRKPPDGVPRTVRFIHLRDAKFYNTTGSPIPGNRGVWWRGRISEVGGFVLGTLGESEA